MCFDEPFSGFTRSRRQRRLFAFATSRPFAAAAFLGARRPRLPTAPHGVVAVGRTQTRLRIAPDTGAVARLVSHVVHRLLPNVARGAVIAYEKVLKIVFESTILKLDPTATDVGCVLPHELGVITDAATALIASAEVSYSGGIEIEDLVEPMPDEFMGVEFSGFSPGDVSGDVLSRALPIAEGVDFAVGVFIMEQKRIFSYEIFFVVDVGALVGPFLRHSRQFVVPLLKEQLEFVKRVLN